MLSRQGVRIIDCESRPTVGLFVLGCKVNQYDAQLIREKFADAGYLPVDSRDTPDVFVIVSCAVTHEAAAKTRRMTRRARRDNPDSIIVLAGCYPQSVVGREQSFDPQEKRRFEQLPVDLVCGVDQLDEIPIKVKEIMCQDPPAQTVVPDVWESHSPSLPRGITGFHGHTRAAVKVQDGCDEFCSYCLIPHLRGPLRARRHADIAEEINNLLQQGYREIILTGIHLGAYERSQGADMSLFELIDRLSDISGDWRLRLSSVEPMDIDSRMFEVMATKERIVPHLHLPLQNGSDQVLNDMGRRYDTSDFQSLVQKARQHMPDIGLSTDIMVGFPTETTEEFRQSLEFVRQMRFSRIHVFPYSFRSGTRASKYNNIVDDKERTRRKKQMLAVARQSSKNFHNQQKGKSLRVLIEKVISDHQSVPFELEDDYSIFYGYSGNYTPIWTASEASRDISHEFVYVRIIDAHERGCLGIASFEC